MSEEAKVPDKKPGEAMLVAYYTSYRQELIQRIVLRDGALIFYATGMGAYFNYLLRDLTIEKVRSDMFLAVALGAPLGIFSLCFTLIVLQHHVAIGKLGAFGRLELTEQCRQLGLPTIHWDNSRALNSSVDFFHRYRLFSQALILIVPLFYYLYFGVQFWSLFSSSGLLCILLAELVFGLLIAIAVACLHYKAHQIRNMSVSEGLR